MHGFLLPRIARMGGEGVIEGFPVDVLRMRREVACDRRRQIVVVRYGIGLLSAY